MKKMVGERRDRSVRVGERGGREREGEIREGINVRKQEREEGARGRERERG